MHHGRLEVNTAKSSLIDCYTACPMSIYNSRSVIGTSTNLVVQGILQKKGEPQMKFFDIALVGAPALVVGTLYLVTIGWWLLPNSMSKVPHSDVDSASVADYTAELVVDPDSPLIGKHVNLHISTVFSGRAKLVKLMRAPPPRLNHNAETLISSGICAPSAGNLNDIEVARAAEGADVILGINNLAGTMTLAARWLLKLPSFLIMLQVVG